MSFKKRKIFIYILLINSFNILNAFDIKVRIDPMVLIPVGDSADDMYSIGGGVSGDLSLELFDLMLISADFGTSLTPFFNTGTYAQFINTGLGTSLYTYPFSIMTFEIGGAGGVYTLTYNDDSISNLWWKIFGSVGVRLSPYFSLSIYSGYLNYKGSSQDIYSGIFAGLSAGFSFDTLGSKGNIDLSLYQEDPILPISYSLYKDNMIGVLTITNNESAEIKNVNISFKAENYTGSEYLCGNTRIIKKKASIDIPLYADFTENVQNFTEDGKISGEVLISYEILGSKKSIKKSVVVDVYNRNSFNWSDTASLASFISPNAPEVLDYSKYIVGVARSNLRTGLNRNMQFAMYLFEGLKTAGISYSSDQSTPYSTFHNNPLLIDYVQYPFQTLNFHMGDYDDIGLLICATLESVGIKSAIVTTETDFIVAYSLNINKKEAEKLFDNIDNLLIINDEVWMPLNVSSLREGFINSWNSAMNTLQTAFKNNEKVDFIIIQDAWETYSPSGIKGKDIDFEKPLEAKLKAEVETDLLRYIASEFGPKIDVVKNNMLKEGESSKLLNSLGQLYVRAGLYELAKNEFSKSVDMGSFAALINLGNIYMIQRDFTSAKLLFQQALELKPENKTALKAYDRVIAELEL